MFSRPATAAHTHLRSTLRRWQFLEERASGVHLEGNIVHSSDVRVGGNGPPSEENVVKDNYLGLSELQIGLGAPTQAEVTGNVIAWSYLDSRYLWVADDPAYGSPSKPSKYQNNQVYHPPVDNDLARDDDLPVVDLGTAQYASASDKHKMGVRPQLGNAPLPSSLVFNQNTYGGRSIFFRLNAGGVRTRFDSLGEWQNATRAAGKALDSGSRVVDLVNKTASVYVQSNLYDRQRAYVAVFNYQRAEEVEFSLKDAFGALQGEYKVYRSTERWKGDDAVVAKGKLPSSTITVKVGTDLFSTWIVVANDGKVEEQDGVDQVDACPRFTDGCGKSIALLTIFLAHVRARRLYQSTAIAWTASAASPQRCSATRKRKSARTFKAPVLRCLRWRHQR